MTLPDPASKANLDNAADDPEQALLVDCAGLVDKFNELLTHMDISAILSAPLKVGNGLQNVTGFLVVKPDGSTVAVSASGIKVADNAIGMSQLAHQLGAGVIVFTGAGSPAFVAAGSEGDLLGIASGVPAFVQPPAGGWKYIGNKTASGSPAVITYEDAEITPYGALLFLFHGLRRGAGGVSAVRAELKLATSGWTVTDAEGPYNVIHEYEVGTTATFIASAFLDLSSGNSVSNVAGEALSGRLEVFNRGQQSADLGLNFNYLTTYRLSGGNGKSLAVNGRVDPDETTEQIEGFRFYLSSGHDLLGRAQAWGMPLAVPT